ncbi:GNAT family N-acetyltransferase [Actinoplanes sp. NPDC051343]|uniref:GNAT family N-acetyltransferase n=1 Tax=Actinoplanes sp. NPDC051343 TaxID=3363906 RepID=UPI0037975BB6
MSAALIVPTIHFDSWKLRPWMVTDAEALTQASSDPYIPSITSVPKVWTRESAERYIERQWARAEEGVGYSFAIADGEDAAVGSIGLWIRDADLGRASIGYWIVESSRGAGLGTAALKTLAGWAFSVCKIPRIELYVEPWNVASLRTARASGFKEEGLMRSWQEVDSVRRDMLMYSRIAPPVLTDDRSKGLSNG